ncbi:MAG TPA: asparaginase [Candidatus Dormibacteraeota bacterium]|nr:asparaginase [Candidatus Dormibacteraeota bacterium]
MSAPAVLAEVWRGDVLEAVIRGHIAAVSADGTRVAHAGDPDVVTTVRSTVKPLQALPFVAGGAADALGGGAEEFIAIACASHQGEAQHVAVVRDLLQRCGLDETALSCGPHWPYSEDASRALVAEGRVPQRVHNNCSGKHAAMLAACVQAGWPVEGYAAAEHPLQRAVIEAISLACGVDVAAQPRGVDGCGLPTFGLALSTLARGFAAAPSRCGGFVRCQAAMAAHPFLVAGSGRFDTALLEFAGERLTAKVGGAACWVATSRQTGTAVAVKLEAGVGVAMPCVAIAALQALDELPDELPEALRLHAAPPLTNWEGAVVGQTRARVLLQR